MLVQDKDTNTEHNQDFTSHQLFCEIKRQDLQIMNPFLISLILVIFENSHYIKSTK